MVRQFLRTVAFQHAREVGDLCVELLVRLLLQDLLVVTAVVRATCGRPWTHTLTLAAALVWLPLLRRGLLGRLRVLLRRWLTARC